MSCVVAEFPAPGSPGLRVVSCPSALAAARRRDITWLYDRVPAAGRTLYVGGDPGTAVGAQWARVDIHQAWPVGPFDVCVVDCACLAHLPNPGRFFDLVDQVLAPEAAIFFDLQPAIDHGLLLRLFEGDLTDSPAAPLPKSLRHGSVASLFKLLLDHDWMPTVVDAAAPDAAPSWMPAVRDLAAAMGVPVATAERHLAGRRTLVRAERWRGAGPGESPTADGRFVVVVPSNRDLQLRLNVEASPGLAEVEAQVVSHRGASSPAEALERAAAEVKDTWIVLAHQDVYFPRGFGCRLQALLATIPAAERATALIGFAGMGVDAQRQRIGPAGHVIDRTQRFDHPESRQATSIDELAVVVWSQSVHRIDPRMGWHLWATDLCLTAIESHRCFGRIVRLPLFHNSLNDHQLPDAFHHSADVLAAKHAGFGPIPTLCGTIAAGTVAA
jgi:hypothetical protein